MGIQHSRWDFLFFFLRQGRLPEGYARLEGEASGRWVASACYSAPLRPSRELHAPPQPPDSHADCGTARRVPPADGSLHPAYRGNDRASPAFQDSRVRLTAGDLARPWPSEPLYSWGQWSLVLCPGTHIDTALGRASLWDTGQPPPSELRERCLSWYTYWKELVLNLSFTVLPHRDYSRMRDRHTRHSVRVKDL